MARYAQRFGMGAWWNELPVAGKRGNIFLRRGCGAREIVKRCEALCKGIVDGGWQIADCGLWIVDCGLRVFGVGRAGCLRECRSGCAGRNLE